jgi:hypothetical protein
MKNGKKHFGLMGLRDNKRNGIFLPKAKKKSF